MSPDLLDATYQVISNSFRFYRNVVREQLAADPQTINDAQNSIRRDLDRVRKLDNQVDDFLGARYALICWLDHLFCDTENP